MKKSSKIVGIVAVLIVAGLLYSWPLIQMEFAGSAHYTEQDKREYAFYTPDILKKMPRISPRYDFDFANITGPSTHVYAVNFYATEDTSKIDNYLKSIGYQRQDNCNIDNECWKGKDPVETVMVMKLKSEKGVVVQVVYDFTS
ncbi:hypothetical protein [Serratia rhizosphaerae]|uniref:hypothetical protein n=1 Tax=Serratia rhizosphaerae TaxID=2597702 RepID=UPI002DB91A17|nr:hypothetical protein [Serratia rhizosphaerae]MEB6335259.1 hypothetical protein [Serratia rhizosphaerae]